MHYELQENVVFNGNGMPCERYVLRNRLLQKDAFERDILTDRVSCLYRYFISCSIVIVVNCIPCVNLLIYTMYIDVNTM
jgi:hypothetical protein